MSGKWIQEISTFELFSALSDKVKAQLASLLKEDGFAKGTTILKRGQSNSTLFFLREGSVEIQLEGESVSKLSTIGEVFGEMSAFIGQPISASIRAATDVRVFKMEVADFENVLKNETANQHRALSRVFASILTRRLINTNDKAKRFEVANRELLETQAKLKALNEEIQEIGRKQALELNHSIDSTIKRIMSIEQNYLEPLRDTLKQVNPASESIDRALVAIEEVLGGLDPLRKYLNTENVIRQKKVLLIDPDRRQQIIARMALGGTGVQLSIASTAAEAKSAMGNTIFDLVFCDISLVDDLAEPFSSYHLGKITVMSSGAIDSDLAKFKNKAHMVNLLTRDDEDRQFTVKNIVATITKQLSKDIFGIEKYLALGVDIRETQLLESGKRRSINEEVQGYFKSLGVRSAILTRVETALEEMMMNAVYDAPVDEKGENKFNHLPRTESISLKEVEAAKVRFACDGLYMAVSVEDPFGALKKEVLIAYIESCYSGEAGSLNFGKGGAGRGLHMIIQSSDLTIFNVKAGYRTEVIALYRLDAALARKETKPTLHFFFT